MYRIDSDGIYVMVFPYIYILCYRDAIIVSLII